MSAARTKILLHMICAKICAKNIKIHQFSFIPVDNRSRDSSVGPQNFKSLLEVELNTALYKGQTRGLIVSTEFTVMKRSLTTRESKYIKKCFVKN